MYTSNREAYRQTFYTTWQKYQNQLPLTLVEQQLVEVILQHPEYHALITHPDHFQQQEFTLEENPFFHMSLHLAVREQIQTNRPDGIVQLHQALLQKHQDPHSVEHKIMTCLAQTLWAAQQNGAMPDEKDYLGKIKNIDEDE